jgi:hypothetical protein
MQLSRFLTSLRSTPLSDGIAVAVGKKYTVNIMLGGGHQLNLHCPMLLVELLQQ